MTELHDKPRKFEGKLKPYPHEEFGVEARSTIFDGLRIAASASGDCNNAHCIS